MKNTYRVLAINPKLTELKFALYANEHCLVEKTLQIPSSLQRSSANSLRIVASKQKDLILSVLHKKGIQLSSLDAVVSRGGLLRPISGGTYEVNEIMLKDLIEEYNGSHPANLGGVIASEIQKQLDIKSFIVDPVVVDELSPYARTTGMPEIQRKSIFHALSQKHAGRKAAKELEINYEDSRFVIVHIGGGISVGLHDHGRVVDVNNGLHGDGPIAPERAGTLPAGALIDLCYSGKYTKAEMLEKVSEKGGLASYFALSDLEDINLKAKEGNKKAVFLLDVMAYQIAKEIGALATTVCGQVDAIVLTGRFTEEMIFVNPIIDRVKWIADVFVYPGENVLESLAAGALRVLRNIEQKKIYRVNPSYEKEVK